MPAMPVTILPIAATSKEVKEMIEVFGKAFGPDPLMQLCFERPNVPRKPKEEVVAEHLDRGYSTVRLPQGCRSRES
jgi:hypothetical protein